MFPLDLLRISLARTVLVRIEMPCLRAPIIGVIARAAKWREQRFEVQQPLILPPAKDIRQPLACPVIDGMPQPARRGLLPHIGPHCIDFRFLPSLDHHIDLGRTQRLAQRLVHCGERRLFFFNSLMTVVVLIFSTRAVARIPLPLRRMSTICSLIAGARPL
jgi:hypothetical protein